jgi:hypothetical protein
MHHYNIFVSYSRKDIQLVAPLVQLLRITNNDIFQDINIPPGNRWRGFIVNSIQDCEIFLLFWCRHSLSSKEVKNEYELALDFDKMIVPVRIDDAEIPPLIAEYQYIDMRYVFNKHEQLIENQSPKIVHENLISDDEISVLNSKLILNGFQYLYIAMDKILTKIKKTD